MKLDYLIAAGFMIITLSYLASGIWKMKEQRIMLQKMFNENAK